VAVNTASRDVLRRVRPRRYRKDTSSRSIRSAVKPPTPPSPQVVYIVADDCGKPWREDQSSLVNRGKAARSALTGDDARWDSDTRPIGKDRRPPPPCARWCSEASHERVRPASARQRRARRCRTADRGGARRQAVEERSCLGRDRDRRRADAACQHDATITGDADLAQIGKPPQPWQADRGIAR